jgi:hypothetical protein
VVRGDRSSGYARRWRHRTGNPGRARSLVARKYWDARIGRGECARIVCEFEGHALTQAHTVPILWYNRIVPTTGNVKGWNMTPSRYIGQDLADVCMDR